MLNLVGIQYLLGPQHWTSTIFQLGWGPQSPATYKCVKETKGGSPRSQRGPWRDGPRYLKSRTPFLMEKLCPNISTLQRALGPLLWWRMWGIAASPGFKVKLQVLGVVKGLERMGKAGELELLSSLQEINHFLHV